MLFVPPSMPFMVPEAEAATTHTIEMTETGFSQTTITITVGDSIRFLNTHMKANGSIEPHAISDPESIAVSELSYIILSDNYLSHTFSSDKINFGNPGTEKFYDRFLDKDDGSCCPESADQAGGSCCPVAVTIVPPPDTTPPVIHVNQITQWSGAEPLVNNAIEVTMSGTVNDPVVYWSATATDNVGVTSVGGATCTGYLDTFPVGTSTVTCTASDAAGNVGTYSFSVIVTSDTSPDTTPPVFGSLEYRDESYEIHGANLVDKWPISGLYGDNAVWTITATDNVDVVSGPTCNPASGSQFPVGDTTVTCTASDAAGNEVTAIFTVTIWPCCDGIDPNSLSGDTTPPVITVPSNQTLTTNGINQVLLSHSFPSNSTGYYYAVGGVTATDNGPGYVEPTCMAVAPDGTTWSVPPNMYVTPRFNSQFGTTTITCTVTDAAGNSATGSFTITAIFDDDDTTPTTIAATAYLNATSPTGRTLSMVGSDMASSGWGVNAWIFKDGTERIGFGVGTQIAIAAWQPTWQIPIPEDWEAGTYDILWGPGAGFQSFMLAEGSTTVTVPALPDTAEAAEAAEEEIVIPAWIKNNAGWWASNQIDDRSFVSGLQWLISNGIMNIPPTEQGAGSDDVIPSWIKNNAGWWADDLIDDRNFVTGLQWLITNGIMVIS